MEMVGCTGVVCATFTTTSWAGISVPPISTAGQVAWSVPTTVMRTPVED
ncbi:MAG TPA: hypothetical protein VFZ66_13610 [Herpetosiphonaceae bacterium]